MFRSSIKFLFAHKIRWALCVLSISLSVAFVTGSLTINNMLASSLKTIMRSTVADVNVAAKGFFNINNSTPIFSTQSTLSDDQISAVKNISGVEKVEGIVVTSNSYPITNDNHLTISGDSPGIGMSWFTISAMDNQPGPTIQQGSSPKLDNEVVIDTRTFNKGKFKIGDKINISTFAGIVTKKLVGVANWGDVTTTGGAYTFFTLNEAQKLFLQDKKAYNLVLVSAKQGENVKVLAKKISKILPTEFESLTGKKIATDREQNFGPNISFFSKILLILAFIAFFIAGLIILNTFNIMVSQQSRELGLLRTIGAKKIQIVKYLLMEGLLLGSIGSIFGIVLGYGLTELVKFLFPINGFDLALVKIPVSVIVILESLLAGIVVTLIAALVPAWKASRLPPLPTILKEDTTIKYRASWFVISGLVSLEIGVAGLLCGTLFQIPYRGVYVGIGALLTILGVVLAIGFIGRPITLLIGKLTQKIFGEIGYLAHRNVLRHPIRTSATATGLMIGLVLVTTLSILSSSAQGTIREKIEDSVRGDFQIFSVTGQSFSTKFGNQIAVLPQVAHIHRIKLGVANIDSQPTSIAGSDSNSFDKIFHQILLKGKLPSNKSEVILEKDFARKKALTVGDSVSISSGSANIKMVVSGIFTYGEGKKISNIIMTIAQFKSFDRDTDFALSIDSKSPAEKSQLRVELDKITKGQPTILVTNSVEWANLQIDSFDSLTKAIYAVLGLAIFISILGLVNTVMLSVTERIRELGMLRVVGLKRKQLKLMISLESLNIMLLGTVFGVSLGIILGTCIQHVLVNSGMSLLVIPWGQVFLILIVAFVVGLLAALWPADKAAKTNMLKAIVSE